MSKKLSVTEMPFFTINMIETGRNITNLREKNHYSVKDLQRYFGFEYPQAIYKWQRGESLPSVDNLIGLSFLFRVPINDILVVNESVFCYNAA